MSPNKSIEDDLFEKRIEEASPTRKKANKGFVEDLERDVLGRYSSSMFSKEKHSSTEKSSFSFFSWWTKLMSPKQLSYVFSILMIAFLSTRIYSQWSTKSIPADPSQTTPQEELSLQNDTTTTTSLNYSENIDTNKSVDIADQIPTQDKDGGVTPLQRKNTQVPKIITPPTEPLVKEGKSIAIVEPSVTGDQKGEDMSTSIEVSALEEPSPTKTATPTPTPKKTATPKI